MGQKDITEKILEDYNDVFADIVNTFLFGGEQIVTEDSLKESSVHSQYKFDNKMHEQERDVAKYWEEKGVVLALMGLENQSVVDKTMPLRILGYEGADYRSQLLKEKNKGQLHCVVTLVLNFSEKKWNDNYKSLYGVVNIPEELKPFVNDYKINVVDVAYLEDEVISRLTSDFKIIVEFFVAKRKNPDGYKPSEQVIKHVDEFLKLLDSISGDSRYVEAYKNLPKGGNVTMCTIADSLEKKGVAQGIVQGSNEKANKVIRKMHNKGYDIEEIADVTEVSVDYVREILYDTITA